MGGSVEAIGFMKGEIEESAWGYQERYRTGQDIVVGVNKYVTEELEVPDILKVDQASEDAQVERLANFKANRDGELVGRRLDELRETAQGGENLLPGIREALRDGASIGEVCGAMKDVFGEYRPEF
jgi:methylmalonyl-CoA mutase N-terminal domain/subunit